MAGISLNVPLRRKKPSQVVLPTFTPMGEDLKDHLPGEITIAKATNVRQVVYFGERSTLLNWEVNGSLYCTNHRICFIPDMDKLPDVSGQCFLEASRRIPLTCISRINIVSSKSRKVLDTGATLPKKLSQIQIVCKDVRALVFNLKNANKGEAFSLVNAIGRHAHPSSVNLLFAFDYARASKSSHREQGFSPDGPPVPSFLNARDWQRELLRLGITNDQWRVSEANKLFLVCNSLSPFFPCPTSFTNSSLESAATLHSNNRIPVWCWSHPRTGVSLTRGGALLVDDEGEAPDPNYRVSITMARHTAEQVENKGIHQLNVHRKCGTPKDLNRAFTKMRELCTPGCMADLQSQDKHWYGSLESNDWLNIVRSCLLTATNVTHLLCIKHTAVMLLEESKCDLSCVVSSLVQLMADSHYRSISGFESLVQKEWVALGHSFTTRHGLVVDLNAEDRQEAPVMLLFLDCVWQLSRQFPSAFEFSEFYLLRFYDMVLTGLFSNFLFDCPSHRLQASRYSRRSCFFGVGDEPLEMAEDYEGPLLSAWSHWREDMSKEENEQCLNPLFYIFGNGDNQMDSDNSAPLTEQFGSFLTESGSSSRSDPKLNVRGGREVTPISVASSGQVIDYYQKGLLVPETSLCSLHVWGGFFFRYIPELGSTTRERTLCLQRLESRMVRDVQKLKEELNELELSMGVTYTTDLPTCIGEVVLAREKELLADRRESIEVVPLRPLLTASVYSYEGLDALGELLGTTIRESSEEADGANISINHTPIGSPPSTPSDLGSNPAISFSFPQNGSAPLKTTPSVSSEAGLSGGSLSASNSPKVNALRQTSLVQFTDALYNTEKEAGSRVRTGGLERGGAATLSASSRSPVTKTRVRVVKSQTNDPVVAAWQVSPRQSIKNRELTRQRSTENEKPLPVPVVLRSSELTDL